MEPQVGAPGWPPMPREQLHCFPGQQQPGGINLKPIQDFHPNTSASLAVGRAARVTLEGRGADRLGRGVTAGGALLSCLGCLGWLGSSSSSSELMMEKT